MYWAPNNSEFASDASELFLSRELWANTPYYLNITSDTSIPFIPTGAVEEVFIDTLINFCQIAQGDLKMPLPVEIKAGLVGIRDYRLAVDPQYFGYDKYAGHILRESVLFDQLLSDWNSDPFEFLSPLFSKIYDSAGIERPDVRTAGRRQR